MFFDININASSKFLEHLEDSCQALWYLDFQRTLEGHTEDTLFSRLLETNLNSIFLKNEINWVAENIEN